MRNFVNNRTYDELIEMLDMIQDRMEIMKHKRKDDKWAKVRD